MVLGALAFASCREPTQITLRISTDLPCSEVGTTSIMVGRLGELEGKPAAASTSSCDAGRIGTLVVVPSSADDAPVAVQVVTGLGPTPEQCAEAGYQGGCIVARRALRFIPRQPLVLPIEMSGACRDRPCEPTETCLDGACVSAQVPDPIACPRPNSCQPVDAGAPDVVADAGGDGDSPDALDGTLDAADAGEPSDAVDALADGKADVSPCVSPIAGGSCDTFPQCGCSAGQTCSIAADTTSCVPAGSQGLEQLCTVTSLCKPGTDCFYYSSLPGACKTYCEKDADCSGGTSTCIPVVDSSAAEIPGVGFCSSGCALENPTAKCGTLGCLVVGTNPNAVSTDCQPVGTATVGASCSGQLDCAPGYGCYNSTTCQRWCRVGSGDCGDAGTCVFGNITTVTGVAYGVCL